MSTIAHLIDHTLLSPVASETDIRKLCAEAWQNQFKAVCVAPGYVPYVVEMLEFCPVRIDIATVVGYPFGFTGTAVKLLETKNALAEGANQVEVVMNLNRFKSMAYLSVREELRQLADIVHAAGATMGIIVETALLDTFEIHTALEICGESGANFINISSNADQDPPQPEHIQLIRSVLSRNLYVKVSGRLQDYNTALSLIHAGAERIGTFDGVKVLSGV